MEANELRIGNIVYHDVNGEVLVDGIHPNGNHINIRCEKEHEGKRAWREIDSFNPIPLTEEWLLKFGLTKLNAAWIIDDGSVNDYGHMIIGKDTFVLFDHSYGFLTDLKFGIYPIKYVHQLQNLYFALTQTELPC